ncbi:Prokaryotic diacylglycerol kinase superfamily [Verrucomicrobiia bacterium DG1235]|nr:Prokaryotic diacylglycerol kinase superfamily [Verrucomicrobiae bacterium DG1235]
MKRRFDSFRHAFRGIANFIALGTNAKLQLIAAIVTLLAGFPLGYKAYEWVAVILCIGMVLTAEAFNTALEELSNEVTKERKESIRRVKDIAAGAVLLAAISSVAVAATIIAQRLF